MGAADGNPVSEYIQGKTSNAIAMSVIGRLESPAAKITGLQGISEALLQQADRNARETPLPASLSSPRCVFLKAILTLFGGRENCIQALDPTTPINTIQ